MDNFAILFPGQGSQYMGMGKDVYNVSKEMVNTFEEASDILNRDFKKICFETTEMELMQTDHTQLSVFVMSMAYYRVYKQEIGIIPRVLLGHSLGEITALTAAEAIRFEDALKIVECRSNLMKQISQQRQGGMLAVKDVEEEQLNEICKELSNEKEVLEIANINSKNQIVVSGDFNAINLLHKYLEEKGIISKKLNVSGAFHSTLMKPIVQSFKEELLKYKFDKLKYDVISNVEGIYYSSENEIVENLSKQLFLPVQWKKSMMLLKQLQITDAIEMGPKSVLKNLVIQNDSTIRSYTYDSEDDRKKLKQLKTLQQSVNVEFIYKCIKHAVCTRNKNYKEEEYQLGVIKPYRMIQEILKISEKENRVPSIAEMKRALELLNIIFKTKLIPQTEACIRIEEILNETNVKKIL